MLIILKYRYVFEIFLIILILEVVAFSILKSKRFKDRYSYIKRYFDAI